ncbi:multidrug resistance-associated ABC transporter [Wolfiporia cocos MD-104 SS10]|uniref:Multidrug resistance-associated ABC transporter n=1 Tax=Wolfiporia cocos (strain MD-104) TaxID=742152 RepID=A0A2H3IZZ3_WOLCO|nr:multidrug resistance-associated ABC transporter [Wolfiporia cocos MD-104 SS10]
MSFPDKIDGRVLLPEVRQVVLGFTRNSSIFRTKLDDEPRDAFWDTLTIPVLSAGLSAIILGVQFTLRYRARTVPETVEHSEDNPDLNGAKSTSIAWRVASLGGPTILAFHAVRLLACLILAVLEIFTSYLLWSEARGHVTMTAQAWLHVGLLATYVYSLALAVVSILPSPSVNVLVVRHLNAVLLSALVVYVYRDVWPLTTYTLVPLDADLDRLLWYKFGVLTVAAVAVPLLIPRRYIPFDPENPSINPSPEQTASMMSMMLYAWLDPTVSEASRSRHLPLDRFPPLADYDEAQNLMNHNSVVLDLCQSQQRFKDTHIFWRLVRIFRSDLVFMGIMLSLRVAFQFASPLGMRNLLRYMETGGAGTIVRPWVWIAWLFIGPSMNAVATSSYSFVRTRMSVRVEAILTQIIFDHALHMRIHANVQDSATHSNAMEVNRDPEDDANGGDISNSATLRNEELPENAEEDTAFDDHSKKDAAKATEAQKERASNFAGRLNNLISSDVSTVAGSREVMILLVEMPLQMVACVWFLYSILGSSAIVGMVVMIILFPIPGYVAKMSKAAQSTKMEKSDSRVQVATETINVIRMIKLFGWEKRLSDRLREKRAEELHWIKRSKLLEIANPILNVILTSQQTELLDEATEKKDKVTSQSLESRIVREDIIGFRQADFTWSNEEDRPPTPGTNRRQFRLRIDVELHFKRGAINLIVGPTGSGKTSMLMALLGEMHYVPYGLDSYLSLPRDRGVAYAAQESWVQNETIRDNILFGSAFEEERFNKVIYQCGLNRDLELFDAGDLTEVGERGITLSGGQKARVTLARAIYSNAEILLLDDVLAALDVHTGRWIVDKCLKGDLIRGRTVIMVTHNVAMVSPIAQLVVSLGTDGRVLSQGTLCNALECSAELAAEAAAEELAASSDSGDTSHLNGDATIAKRNSNGKLILAEEIAEGHVGWPALKMYFAGLGGRYPLLFWTTCLTAILLCYSLGDFQVWFLGYWARQYEERAPSEVKAPIYLSIYAAILVWSEVFYSTAMITYLYGTLRASHKIHETLMASVLGTTLRWLDKTPTSRVLARCTQDIQAVDADVGRYLVYLIDLGTAMVIKLVAVVIVSPPFIAPGALLAVICGCIGQAYMKAQLSVKREASNARAPIMGHLGAAFAGLVSIRAYGAQDMFRRESYVRINRYTRASRTLWNLNQWASIRMESLGALFTSSLATYLVYGSSTSASNAGFSLTMAVGFSGIILWLVRNVNEFEVSSNSLERIKQYVDIEQEPTPTERGIPPAYWPSSGDLRVEKLSARYSKDGPKVLNDISFEVKSGERVGIVGRTGSGKSSLTLALLRCIIAEGTVFYDGLATDDINLDVLRSKITIIPQMPELLSGTLRENLDPFGEYDDATLNDALRSAGLFSLQSEMHEGRITLDTHVESGGSNFSVGQRQILALARAIVRQSRLLILDEATSAIDYATDMVIQESLRKELDRGMTVLTVAHRLRTIMDSDKIMVLDAGHIVEFGKPANLLNTPGSMLQALVDESGDREELYVMATGTNLSAQS